jgi:hypothetical protein
MSESKIIIYFIFWLFVVSKKGNSVVKGAHSTFLYAEEIIFISEPHKMSDSGITSRFNTTSHPHPFPSYQPFLKLFPEEMF